MANPASNPASNPETNLVTVPPTGGVITDIRIDQSDILVVIVSRAEKMIQEKVAEWLVQVHRLETLHAEFTDQLNKLIVAAGAAYYQNSVRLFEQAFAAASAKPNFRTAASLRDNRSVIEIELGVGNAGHGHNLHFSAKIPCDAEQQQLLKKIDTTADSLKLAREEVVTWRKKLANIPSLERQYKTKMVEDQLAKTTQGQEILKSFDLANFEKSVLALPNL